MKRDWRRVSASVAVTALATMIWDARAQATDFFKDKQLKLIVGSPAGAGFDFFGRLVARHLSDHLPGNPNIVVVNMPGAGSLRAVQSIRAQPADGTYIVLFNPGQVLNSVLEPGKVMVNFTKDVSFLGSGTADARVCYSWAATSKIKTLHDLLSGKDTLTTGHAGTSAATYIDAAILKNLFKAPVKQVVGYSGSAAQRLAVERGELTGDCGSWGSVPRDWIRDKKINLFVRISKVASPELASLPFIGDVGNEDQKRLIRLITSYNDMYFPFIVHKGVPAGRLKVLREAFWNTVNSKPVLAAAERADRSVIEPISGDDLDQLVDELYRTPPELVAKASQAVK